MTSAFDIFDATTVPGVAEQLNAWGADLETTIRNNYQITEAAHNEQKVTLEALVYDLRSTFRAHTAELENLKNVVVMLEMRAEHLEQYSGKAVVELDAIMAAFRAELVQSRGDRAADCEALKGELRQPAAAVPAKVLELEGAIGPSPRPPRPQPPRGPAARILGSNLASRHLGPLQLASRPRVAPSASTWTPTSPLVLDDPRVAPCASTRTPSTWTPQLASQLASLPVFTEPRLRAARVPKTTLP